MIVIRLAIHSAFDVHDLVVRENVLGMIEINLKRKPLFFIEHIAQAIIVLWYGNGLCKKLPVPPAMIMPLHIFESVIIAQGWLGDVYIAVRVPFGIISPGEIKFVFSLRLLGGSKKGN